MTTESNQKETVVVESRYWLEGLASRVTPSELFQWDLSDRDQGLNDCEVLSIHIDSNPLEFQHSDRRLECQVPLTKLCSEVVLLTRHQVSLETNSTCSVLAPDLQSHSTGSILFMQNASSVPILYRDELQALTSSSDSAGMLAEKWCELFSKSANLTVNVNAQIGSHWERWQRYWNIGAFYRLQAWAVSSSFDSDAYDATVKKWHQVRTLTQSMLSKPAKELLQGTLAERARTFKSQDERSLSETNISQETLQPASTMSDWFQGRMFSLFGSIVLLGCAILIWNVSQNTQWYRPWWLLLSVGLLLWAICGTLLPALLLGLAAFAIALDSYLLVTERLRRTGTRGLR